MPNKNLVRLITTATAALFTLTTCEKVPDYCGKGVWYNPDIEFCDGTTRKYDLCGGQKYNPRTEGCMRGTTVGTMCADETFVKLGSPCDGYTLAVSKAPENGGTVTISPADKKAFAADEQVVLHATAETGYTFAGWAGPIDAKAAASASITLEMNSNRPLIAIFNPSSTSGATTHTLVTAASPENGGTVSVGGTVPEGGISTHNAGAQVTVAATARAGYEFSHWAGASTSTSSPATVTMNESKTLVAVFTPVVCTLTVKTIPDGGGWVFINNTARAGITKLDLGTEIVALARAAEGYRFGGWGGTAAEGLAGDAEASVRINLTGRAMTLIANFEEGEGPVTPTVRRFTVSFDTDGGTPGSISAISVDSGKTAEASFPANPTKADYRFDGWFDGTTQYTASTVITRNVELTARWEPTTTQQGGLLRIFYSDAGEENNTTVDLSVCIYTYFGDWEKVTVKAIEGNAVQRARMQDITVEQIGNNVGGRLIFAAEPMMGTHTNTFRMTDGIATFWMIADPSIPMEIRDAKIRVTSNGIASDERSCIYIVLPSISFTVTFDANGGSSVSPQTVYQGEKVTKPADPTRSAYRFDGWYKEANCETAWNFSGDVVNSNTTLYAKWETTAPPPVEWGDSGTFEDNRGGQTYKYKYVKIGEQVWMAENLNYKTAETATNNSWCYDNDPANCEKYGRLYNWSAAMVACPDGWSLPDTTDWYVLVNAAGGYTAGKALKAGSDWVSRRGTDDYGFSALPGGDREGGTFSHIGHFGVWWTSMERNTSAYWRRMESTSDAVYGNSFTKENGYSVRCIKDY